MAALTGVGLVFNTDAHDSSDFVSLEEGRRIVLGAGLTAQDFS
jgi:hypothetical protein